MEISAVERDVVKPYHLKWLQSVVWALSFATKLASELAGWILFGLAFLTFADVGGRYLFSRPITGALEVMQAAFVWIVFLGFAQTHAQSREIKLDLLVRHFTGKRAHLVTLFTSALSAFVFVLILQRGAQLWLTAWQTHGYSMGRLSIPLIIPYGGLILGSFLAIMVMIRSFVTSVGAIFSNHR